MDPVPRPLFYAFFFQSRRRNTRYWRDWSPDVCSSDRKPPHVVLVVAGDQGEGHRDVLDRVGRQQRRVAAQVQLVDAEGAAEATQDPAAVVGHIERSEERRVGEGWGSRGWAYYEKKKDC